MDQVISVHSEDFDCSVQPGVHRKSINTYLRDTGLWFPIGENKTHAPAHTGVVVPCR